jgi:hypothetical protein
VAESSEHLALVHVIIDYIGREHAHVEALGILSDLTSPLHAERPSRINGFVPDVYAFDAPLTTVIVGEAKTGDDLETQHSKKQFEAFLAFLGRQQTGIFILAVPWQLKRRAEAIISNISAASDAITVKTILLDDLGS